MGIQQLFVIPVATLTAIPHFTYHNSNSYTTFHLYYHKYNSSTTTYLDYHNSNSYTTFHLYYHKYNSSTTTYLDYHNYNNYTIFHKTYHKSEHTTIHTPHGKTDTLEAIKIPGHKLPHGHIPLSLPSFNPPKFLSEQHANTSSVEFTQPLANVSSTTNFSASSRKILLITHSLRIHPLLPS